VLTRLFSVRVTSGELHDVYKNWQDPVNTSFVHFLAFLRGNAPIPQTTESEPAPKEGLASLYPLDTGIERDPRVILVENSEHDSLDGLAKRWETVSGRDTMALSNDRPASSAGREMAAEALREFGWRSVGVGVR
jgi:hypothetical protein